MGVLRQEQAHRRPGACQRRTRLCHPQDQPRRRALFPAGWQRFPGTRQEGHRLRFPRCRQQGDQRGRNAASAEPRDDQQTAQDTGRNSFSSAGVRIYLDRRDGQPSHQRRKQQPQVDSAYRQHQRGQLGRSALE